jgi:hypothetical protein
MRSCLRTWSTLDKWLNLFPIFAIEF